MKKKRVFLITQEIKCFTSEMLWDFRCLQLNEKLYLKDVFTRVVYISCCV